MNTAHAPRVSVVILGHRPHYLPEAFASVVAQTYTDREIVCKFAATYWPEKANEGMAAAQGEFVALLCDDDKLDPTYLARCVEAADRTGVDIIYTDCKVFGRMPMTINLPREPWGVDLLARCCVPYMTALVRRSLWERVRFDGSQPYLDWDFWLGCAKAGASAHHIQEPLYLQRVDGANSTHLMDHDAALALLKAKHPEVGASQQRIRVA